MSSKPYFSVHDALLMMRAAVLCLWPLTVAAAGNSLGATFGQVTLADWLSLLTLSFVSGLVALLYRVRKSLEAMATGAVDSPDLQRIPWWLFALCHMAGAMFVGTLAFFACELFDFNSWLEALAIALAAWSGAKLADQIADAMSVGVVSKVKNALPRRDDDQ